MTAPQFAEQLQGVRKVRGGHRTFAAILDNGSVVAWGPSEHGGDHSSVPEQLKNVQATRGAFAAILADGSVVTWGDPAYGGDSSPVQGQLKNVRSIQAASKAFPAILRDGSVVAWGDERLGGDTRRRTGPGQNVDKGEDFTCDGVLADFDSPVEVEQESPAVEVRSVKQVQSNSHAFAAILDDGSVITWGSDTGGGDSSRVQDQLRDVVQIQGNANAFAAIRADGLVVTWGNPRHGGDT